ncbi:MAG: hypothetical protein K1X94_22785 [Sandaracinaceae bacterium]|nr:hypothetical protein [Sandaracinaceae bacterium]
MVSNTLRTLGAAAVIAAVSSCSATVDVSEFTFDTSPCGPRPPSCAGGGEQRVYAIHWVDIPRRDAEGRRDGFDLDGTSAPICGPIDFVAPDGRTGIDQQMAELLELLEDLGGTNTRDEAERSAASGNAVALVVISNVDDAENDDCVEVTERTAILPDGVTPEMLDVDHDGLLDRDVMFDFSSAHEHDPVACIVDGTLHARFPPTARASFVGMGSEVTVYRGRLRLSLDTEEGLLGGALRIDELTGLDETSLRVLRQAADLEPSARDADDCASVSFALQMGVVPARLGSLRSTP